MSTNAGKKTFIAGEALAAKRRVKIKSGTTTTPPEVVYSDAGEDYDGVTEYAVLIAADVEVVLKNTGGTFEIECTVSGAIARGTVLYGANDGKVSDASSGSAIGKSLEAAVTGQIIECVLDNVKSTTAGTVSIADSDGFTTTATVEAALAELYQNAISIQGFIPISLMSLREVSTMAVGNIAANGGILASDTTPILQPVNGATAGAQEVAWASSNNDPVAFQISLPPDLDDTADLVLHTRIKSAGTSDAVGFTVTSYFNETGAAVSDTSETNQTATWGEKVTTIAAADVPAGAQTLTVSLTPVAHTTDIMHLSALWLEYKTKIKTA
jgi:hypothetical protein